jgi:iron complex transport system ATP-binding protein
MACEDLASLDVAELRFAYDGRPVLDGVTLSVGPGEIVGLVGPNGSGKSTVVRIVSGVLSGFAGTVRVGGADLGRLPRAELARRLAVVPQEPSFAFPFSALEIVLLGRHPHLAGAAFESEGDVRVAREALERCGAGPLAARAIQELSSGERQRVVFAKALAQDPQVLLLDEPASFLDIRHQVELYDVVRELTHARRRAVLTVLHDLNLAAEYCDRIYLLHRGRIAAGGPPAEVLTYETLTRVFETDVHIDVNTLTGKLLVVPLSGRARRDAGRATR